MESVQMEKIIQQFNDLTAKPVKYLAVQNEIKDDIKTLIKSVYDYTKKEETVNKKKKNSALKELIVDDFDEEQIWQQIELQNTECWDQLVWDVANCLSNKNDLTFPVQIGEPVKEKPKKQRKNASEPIVSSEVENTVKPKNKKTDIKSVNPKQNKRSTKHSSIVDDQFFKLKDMEQFLINEEKMEEKGKKKDDDEESIDLFEDFDDDDDDEENGNEMMYKDFFNDENDDEIADDTAGDDEINQSTNDVDDDEDIGDVSDEMEEMDEDIEAESGEEELEKGKEKKVRFAGVQPDSESESDPGDSDVETAKTKDIDKNEKKSEFELRQERLKQQISKLEEKNITEAPWQLKGEVNAMKRPQNSLLQEVLDFDLTTRPAPIITEQTTVTLEGLIQQRIKDKAWDDVVKKEKPIDDQLTFKKTEVLDHAKSKQSLAQVYEAEYLKQKQAASGEKVEEEEPESHKEIRDSMTKLFAKLDALCHYHYTPRAPQAEVKIVSNTPAISMEEVAPVATSDAALLAPEEVKKKQKGDLMSKEERTKTDKNRERRKKKKLQQKKGGQVMKVTDHRNTSKGVEANDKSLKTSKAFFQQLNDDAKSIIKSKNVNKKK
ncbi:unnamed protein product [Colias eurytheme]|nr:unnamed protein product [Colias eurytheme]